MEEDRNIEERSIGEKFQRIATLGGKVKIRKDMKGYYFGDNSKEKLFGMTGPLHPGMPHKAQMALDTIESDTRRGAVRELMEDQELTREGAVEAINYLLRAGILEEVYDPNRREKVLVVKEVKR